MTELQVREVRCVASVAALLGEGPLWCPADRRLYWIDIKGQAAFAFHPGTGGVQRWKLPFAVSAIGLAKGGRFVCACRDGFGFLDLPDRGEAAIEPIVDPEAHEPGNRFNDGAVAPDGSFWAGTMHDAETERRGALYRLAEDGSASRLMGGFMVANGPAFDAARERVYVTDSADRIIRTTDLSGRDPAVFLQFGEDDGYPDGMAVDREGALWVAFWDGACVRRYSADGVLLLQIDLPVSRPTSIALGPGTAYVTSARTGLSVAALDVQPNAGGLFAIGLSRDLAPAEHFTYRG